ncbi:hypothetical protein Tco_1316833 [Tanacetum coccineum]
MILTTRSTRSPTPLDLLDLLDPLHHSPPRATHTTIVTSPPQPPRGCVWFRAARGVFGFGVNSQGGVRLGWQPPPWVAVGGSHRHKGVFVGCGFTTVRVCLVWHGLRCVWFINHPQGVCLVSSTAHKGAFGWGSHRVGCVWMGQPPLGCVWLGQPPGRGRLVGAATWYGAFGLLKNPKGAFGFGYKRLGCVWLAAKLPNGGVWFNEIAKKGCLVQQGYVWFIRNAQRVRLA